jgi:GMP synthase PP-ATPase subunit
MIGAFVYWDLQNRVSGLTKYWPATIGAVFAFFVIVAPGGIAGIAGDLRRYGFATAVRRVFSREARFRSDLADELPVQKSGT